MLSELNKTVARRYSEAYHTGDIDVVMEFIDPSHVRYELVFFLAFSNIARTDNAVHSQGKRVLDRTQKHLACMLVPKLA